MDTLLEAVKEWAKSDPGAVPEEIKAHLKPQDSESDGNFILRLTKAFEHMYYNKEFDVCVCACNGSHSLPVLCHNDTSTRMERAG